MALFFSSVHKANLFITIAVVYCCKSFDKLGTRFVGIFEFDGQFPAEPEMVVLQYVLQGGDVEMYLKMVSM